MVGPTPLIFHRIWLDPHRDDPIPDEFESYWRRFAVLHPTWELKTWSDPRQLEFLLCPAEFNAAQTHAGRSDILRYEILYRFGGVYVDTDVEPLRPFDELLGHEPFIGWEDERLLCPTVMGSPPGHAALGTLLEALPAWFRKYRGAPPNRQTGPYFVTRYLRGRSDVRLLPPVTFYPTHWSEKARLGGPYPDESYAEHKWAAGWLPNGPPQRTH